LELIERNADALEEETWSQVCDTFVRLLRTTNPCVAMTALKREQTDASRRNPHQSEMTDIQRCSLYCSLQSNLLQTVRDLFAGPAYAAVQCEHLFNLVDTVARCYRQAQKFNKSVQLMENHPGKLTIYITLHFIYTAL
jgi:hypothetical protein